MSLNVNSSFDEVITGLKLDGNQLQFVSENFRDNFELCYTAVNQTFSSIRFCSDRLKSDKEIALLAISKTILNQKKDGISGRDIFESIIGQSLRDDFDFILEAFINNSEIQPPEYLLNDLYFMYKVVARKGILIRYASNDIRQNRKIVLLAAKQDGRFLCDINFQIFWNDREIALAASCSSYNFLDCISVEFLSDPEFLEAIISNAKNITKIFNIPNDFLFSSNGILSIRNFTSCFLNLSLDGDKTLLLIRLLDYDFLTKEIIENLKNDLIKTNQKLDSIKIFLAYAKSEGNYNLV